MKRNIYITSMWRQPIRTLLIVVLMALASFTFVLRTVEYMIVRNRIYEIAARFRAVGFIQAAGDDVGTGNIISAVEVIADSPYIVRHDIRRGATGYLRDMTNVDVTGYITGSVDFDFDNISIHTFFYGTVTGVVSRDDTFIRMYVDADYVVAGHPEHVVEGQNLRISIQRADVNAMQSLEVGKRYLFGVSFICTCPTRSIPIVGARSPLDIQPLDEGLWFLPVPEGRADLQQHPNIAARIETRQYAISRIDLRTSIDMSAIPHWQLHMAQWRILAGRGISVEDNEQARMVAVVHRQFAETRGLELGDTIVIQLPAAHHVVEPMLLTSSITTYEGIILTRPHTDFVIIPNDLQQPMYELELEIIGTMRHVRYPSGPMSTLYASYIWIPDSILPQSHSLQNTYTFYMDWYGSYRHGWRPRAISVLADVPYDIPGNYIPSIWYSFELNDPRNQDAFLLRYRATLEAMGYQLTILETNAPAFWAAAAPILLSIALNLIAFWIVFVLVLALVVFLYVRMRRKDFAIMRALGIPAGAALRMLLVAAIVYGLPAVIIGGSAAWYIAMASVAEALYPVNMVIRTFTVVPTLSVIWLVAMLAVVAALMALLILIGAVVQARKPILVLLQRREGP